MLCHTGTFTREFGDVCTLDAGAVYWRISLLCASIQKSQTWQQQHGRAHFNGNDHQLHLFGRCLAYRHLSTTSHFATDVLRYTRNAFRKCELILSFLNCFLILHVLKLFCRFSSVLAAGWKALRKEKRLRHSQNCFHSNQLKQQYCNWVKTTKFFLKVQYQWT